MAATQTVERMKEAWNSRASKDAFFYIETANWDGDVEQFFQLGEERAKLLIDPVLRAHGIVPTGKVALDFGCGVGRFTRALESRFDEYIGVDVAETMVEQAKQLHRDWPGHVTFLASDGVSLPTGPETIDFVYSYEVFQHFPTREVVQNGFAQVAHVLRPQGCALIHCRTKYETAPALRTIYRQFPDRILAWIFRVFGKDVLTSDSAFRGTVLPKPEIEAMCAVAGLEVVEFRDDPTHPGGSRTFVVARPVKAIM